MKNYLTKYFAKAISGLILFVLGSFVGVLAHYSLHRLSLSIEPFIYVSF